MSVAEPPQLEQIAEQVKKALMMPSADYSNGEVAAAPTCSFGDAVRAGAALIELVRLAGDAESLKTEVEIMEQNFVTQAQMYERLAGERDTLREALRIAAAGEVFTKTRTSETVMYPRGALAKFRAALTSDAPGEDREGHSEALRESVAPPGADPPPSGNDELSENWPKPYPQTACEQCSTGVMDAANPHVWGECRCSCHGICDGCDGPLDDAYAYNDGVRLCSRCTDGAAAAVPLTEEPQGE